MKEYKFEVFIKIIYISQYFNLVGFRLQLEVWNYVKKLANDN